MIDDNLFTVLSYENICPNVFNCHKNVLMPKK